VTQNCSIIAIYEIQARTGHFGLNHNLLSTMMKLRRLRDRIMDIASTPENINSSGTYPAEAMHTHKTSEVKQDA